MNNETTPERIRERTTYEKRAEKELGTKAEYGFEARSQDLENEIKEAEPAVADEANKTKKDVAAANTKEASERRDKVAAAAAARTKRI